MRIMVTFHSIENCVWHAFFGAVPDNSITKWINKINLSFLDLAI